MSAENLSIVADLRGKEREREREEKKRKKCLTLSSCKRPTHTEARATFALQAAHLPPPSYDWLLAQRRRALKHPMVSEWDICSF